MFGKTAGLKVLENLQKNVLCSVLLDNSTCPIHTPLTILRTDYTANVFLSVSRVFEIGGWVPVVEILFNKATGEVPAFCKFAEISNTCIGIFQKDVLLEISKKFLLTGVPGL